MTSIVLAVPAKPKIQGASLYRWILICSGMASGKYFAAGAWLMRG